MFALLGKILRLNLAPSFRKEFEFTDQLFGIFGLNYESFRNKIEKSKLNQAISNAGLMVTPIFFIFGVTAVYLNFNQSDVLIHALIGTFTSFNCSTKVLTIFLNARKFTGFRRKILEDSSRSDREPIERDTLERYMHVLALLSKLLIVSYIMAGLTFISMPALFYLIDSDHRWQLPLAMKIIGIDHASHPGYEVHYAYCIITISYGAIVIAACDLTFFYLSFYAMYRLVVSEWYCEQIGQTLHGNRRILLKSIRSHVDVFDFIREVSKAFSSFILVQGLLSLMLLTVTIFYSKLHPVNSTYVFLLTLLIQLFGYCTCGQLVLNRGENVSRAIYCSNWYRIADSEQRRWIQMFILCTQKPNGLSAMNIFQFSFDSLTYILKSAISYIAFLQNVMD